MLVEASLDEIFDVIADIPSYPRFLPWCRSTRILGRDNETRMRVDMRVGKGPVKAGFISDVELDRGKGEIVSRLVSGDLSELESRWTLTPVPRRADGSEFTQIRYAVRYRLRSELLSGVLSSLLDKASQKMVASFAQELRRRQACARL